MKNEKINHALRSNQMILLAIGFGILFWLFDSLLHTFIFHHGNLLNQIFIFKTDPHVIWCRLFVMFTFIAFGIYTKFITSVRNRTEEALQESNELFEKTFKSQRDAIFILNADVPPTIIDCNPAATEIFGYTRQEIFGRTTSFLHVDEGASRKFQEQLYPTIAEHGFLSLPEFEMKRKDGTAFPTEHSVLPLVIVALDPDGNVIMWNPAAERIFGWSEQEVLGRPNPIVPEDKADEFRTLHKRALQDDVSFIEDVRRRKKDGQLIDVSLSRASLRDVKGNVIGALAIISDITERKLAEQTLQESEKRFRDLVENSLTGIFIIQNDQIVYRNPEQERLFGPLPDSFILTDFENIHPDDTEKVKQLYQALESGETQTLLTDIRLYPDNKMNSNVDMKWVLCRASTIEYQGKAAILVNMMDITRAKELEHLLRIEDKMTSLGRVAAGISHEIRNPLAGINMYLNALEKIFYDPEGPEEGDLATAKDIIEKLQSASNKIEGVIRRVLDFSRPTAPKLALVDLNEIIEGAINLVSVTLKKSDIKLQKSLDKDLKKCYAGAPLIEQVLLNLITNAIEAMRKADGDKKIEIISSMENDHIIIKVSDSGPGVPLAIRDKIFDPFYTTKTDGSGIGLSLNHRIVSDHGGSLDVSTSKWGGAEFKIELPIEKRGYKR